MHEKWPMIGIFGHQNLGHGRLGRQAALVKARRRPGLHDTVLALDRIRLRQANRLVADEDAILSVDDVQSVVASDVLASRVFETSPPAVVKQLMNKRKRWLFWDRPLRSHRRERRHHTEHRAFRRNHPNRWIIHVINLSAAPSSAGESHWFGRCEPLTESGLRAVAENPASISSSTT
jgi:hypothetical protein